MLIPPVGAKCINEAPASLSGGIVKTLLDFSVTTLPIPLILKMNMPTKQKLGVAGVIGLGYIVTMAGIVRTYYVWKTLYATDDIAWYSYPLFLAAGIETNLGIVSIY